MSLILLCPKLIRRVSLAVFIRRATLIKNDVGTVKAMATGRKCCHFTSTQWILECIHVNKILGQKGKGTIRNINKGENI